MVLYQRGEIPQEQEEAFLELYQRHQGKILGYLIQKVRNRALAEDVFQLIWLRLHQARLKYDPSFPFLPWLFTISRNIAFDILRQQTSALAHELPTENIEALEVPQAMASIRGSADGGSSGEGVSSTGDSGDSGDSSDASAILELPQKHREPLELRYLKEQSFEQMARALKTSPSNARQRVSRALRFARAHFLNRGGKSS